MRNCFSPPSPQPPGSMMRFIVDRNPFFLLSAVSMFAGVGVRAGATGSGLLPRRRAQADLAARARAGLPLTGDALRRVVARRRNACPGDDASAPAARSRGRSADVGAAGPALSSAAVLLA